MAEKSREHVLAAASALDEARALDTVILDMRTLTSLCDYFVICHGRSSTHLRAIADNTQEIMEEHNIRCHHREGRAQANWIVLDYWDVIIHIFSEEARQFYGLERLWGDAPQVEFDLHVAIESD